MLTVDASVDVFPPVVSVEAGFVSLHQVKFRHSQSPDVVELHFSIWSRLWFYSPSLPAKLTPTRKKEDLKVFP